MTDNGRVSYLFPTTQGTDCEDGTSGGRHVYNQFSGERRRSGVLLDSVLKVRRTPIATGIHPHCTRSKFSHLEIFYDASPLVSRKLLPFKTTTFLR